LPTKIILQKTVLMQNSHIFSQILQKIDWNHFSKVVDKYQGDARSKGLTTKSIFTTMIFAQISALILFVKSAKEWLCKVGI